MMSATPLRERKAWQALGRPYAGNSGAHLRDLFAADPARGERLTAEAVGIYLDYSKNRITDETLALLVDLAEESGVTEGRGRGTRCSVASTSTCPRTGRCCTRRSGCRPRRRLWSTDRMSWRTYTPSW